MESPARNTFPTQSATCDLHGEYDSVNYFGSRWSGCRKCASEEERTRNEKAERALRRERCDAWILASGLEGRFADSSFDNFHAATDAQQKVLTSCREYAANVSWNSGVGLWLIGPPGTGKTHLGSAMVRHIIEERDEPAAIFSGREIIRRLRATWGGKGTESEEAVISDLGHMRLLVIDEIGVSFGTDAEHVQLFDIIDLRYKHRRPTVLLSNLNAKALKEAMGDRAYDRLREGAQVLVCNWDSNRGKRPAARSGLEVVR